MSYKYFAYCPDSGFETFKTEEEAIKYAQDAVDWFRDGASEGWDESVAQVCWGKILQEAKIVDEMSTKEAEEKLGIIISADCSGYCDYKLEDL